MLDMMNATHTGAEKMSKHTAGTLENRERWDFLAYLRLFRCRLT